MPTNYPKSRYYDQGGIRALAEALLDAFGRQITCSVCEVVPSKFNAFCLNEGGKPTKDGLKRRFFRCRLASQQKQENDSSCPTLNCEGYIARAFETIGWKRVEDRRRDVVAECRRRELDVGRIEAPIPQPLTRPSDRRRADPTSDEIARRPLKRPPTRRGEDGDGEKEGYRFSPESKRTCQETKSGNSQITLGPIHNQITPRSIYNQITPKSIDDRTRAQSVQETRSLKSPSDLTIEFRRLQDSLLEFGRYLGVVERTVDQKPAVRPLPSTIPDSEDDGRSDPFDFPPPSPVSASWAFLQSTPTPPGTPLHPRPSPDYPHRRGDETEVIVIESSSPRRQETIRKTPSSVFRAFAKTVDKESSRVDAKS